MLIGTVVALAVLAALASLPWWLPSRVVALRVRVFERINGDEAIPVPGDLVGVDRFKEVYSHPAAGGRSEGAALSDLFWYWLSPGAEVHQEHLEAGERYEAVALATRAFLAMPRAEAEELTRRCVDRELTGGMPGAPGERRLVRLRDLMMPVWAAFYYEVVFGEPCPPAARDLIVGNADDVVTALKCCGLRHMDRRHRLTRYLLGRLGDVRHPLPEGLSPQEQAYYLQGTFFNTAVVQMSEAMAHLLMVFARHPGVQERAREEDARYLDHVIAETQRLYPLFGIAHRVTTDVIDLDGSTKIPPGAVLCFNYPEYHRSGHTDPDRFDPGRWARPSAARDAHHIPFGVAANRPCPAWRLAPITMRVAALRILHGCDLATSASHTRSLPNRGPCLLTARGVPSDTSRHAGPAAPRPVRSLLPGVLPTRARLMMMRVRDRWEDVGRSLVQLALGTFMVWDARRLRLCQRHFASAQADRPFM